MLIANSSGVEFKRLYQSSGKEKESRCLVLTGPRPRPRPSLLSRDLNQRRRQQQRQKNNWFHEQNNCSARASRFFSAFL